MKNIQLLCPVCNTSFDRSLSEHNKSIRRYGNTFVPKCSPECKYEEKRTGKTSIVMQCSQCGSNVTKFPHLIKKSERIFCNRSCSAKYNNTHKTSGTRRSKLEIYLLEQIKEKYPSLVILNNDVKTTGFELDLYLPELKIAFELNGIFHYEPIYGVDKFERTTNRDKQKAHFCNEAGIELCIIDTSGQKRFTEKSSAIYLDIIVSIIETIKQRVV